MAGNFIGIDRQDLGDPLSREGQAQDLKASTNTIDRSFKQDATPVGPAENIFDVIYKAAGTTLDAANNVAQMKIEEDKTLQTMRFYEGMAPSDDATVAGYRAHAILGMQNSVLENTANLKNEAATFTGTDEEWEEKVRASQKATTEAAFQQYPHLRKDHDTLKAITTLYGEQVPQVAAARVAAKLTMEHETRLVALSDNLVLRTKGLSGAEKFKALDAVMNEAADAMQLTSSDREKALVALAVREAGNGDLSYIEYTKQHKGRAGTSLYERTAALQTAEDAGQKVWVKQNQAALATEKTQIIERLERKELTRDQFFGEMGKLNSRYFFLATTDNEMMSAAELVEAGQNKDAEPWTHQGEDAALKANLEDALKAGRYKGNRSGFFAAGQGLNTGKQRMVITDSEMQSMWDEHERGVGEKTDLAPLVNEFYNPNPVTPLGQTEEGIKNNDAIVAEAKKIRDAAINAQIARLPKGSDPAAAQQLRDAAQREYIQYLGRQRVEDKDFSKVLGSIRFTDMSDAKNMKNLSPGVEQALSLYNMMPPSARDVHVPDKQVQAIFENFQTFTEEGISRVSAMEKAVFAYRHPQNIGGTKASALAEAATEAANDQTSRYHTFAGFIPFGGETTASDWYRSEVHQPMVYRMAMANMLSGVVDPKRAAEMATKAIDENYTRLPDGKYLQGTPGVLAKAMRVVPEEIPKVVQAYLEQNKKVLEDQAGVPIDEMYIVTDPTRGTFQVKTVLNDTLGAPMPLAQMKRGYQGYIEEQKKNGLWSRMFNGLSNAGMPDVPPGTPLFSHPENHFEDQERLVRTIAFVEGNGGYNEKTKTFKPYLDGNGKQHNIGYGHMLTPKELASGYIEVKGKRYSLGNKYASQITPNVAKLILEEDLDRSAGKLRKSWPGYDKLPAKYKGVLLNLDYNVGSASPVVWPKLKAAMEKGDDAAVRREMVAYYKSPQGDKKYLTGRADIVADRLLLKRK